MKYVYHLVACGFLGAISAHVAYVKSNMFILGDSTRRGKHLLFDPLAFDGLGFIWGLVVGIAVALWLSTATPVKSLITALSITLAGVVIVGGGATYKRYLALPKTPLIPGPALVLEFEVRFPVGRDSKGPLPTRGALDPASKEGALAQMYPRDIRTDEGRVVLPCRVPLQYADSPRLICIQDHDGSYKNFTLPLEDIPTDADRNWTAWTNAVNVEPGARPTQVFQIRHRVRLASEK